MVIYERLENLLSDSGVSKAFIAQKLGRSRTFLHDVKAGKCGISDADLSVIADLLHTTVDYLTGKTDEKKSAAIEGDGRRQKFISLFEKLTPEMQDAIISLLESSQSKE